MVKYYMSLNHENTQKEHSELFMGPVTKQNAITINECVHDMQDCWFPLRCRTHFTSSGSLLCFWWWLFADISGQSFSPFFKGQTTFTLEYGTKSCPETSVNNYQYAVPYIYRGDQRPGVNDIIVDALIISIVISRARK